MDSDGKDFEDISRNYSSAYAGSSQQYDGNRVPFQLPSSIYWLNNQIVDTLSHSLPKPSPAVTVPHTSSVKKQAPSERVPSIPVPMENANTTYEKLKNDALKGSSLDVFTAGEIIYKGITGQPEGMAQHEAHKFAKDFRMKVKMTGFPTRENMINTHFSTYMSLGNSLMNQIILMRTEPKATNVSVLTQEFDVIPGHGSSFVKLAYKYPGFGIWKDSTFNLARLPRPTKKCPPHVQLKRCITALLQDSCNNPADIKNVKFSDHDDADGEVANTNSIFEFPDSLVDSLQGFFSEYFLIEDPSLDDNTYQPEKHSNLRCIEMYRGVKPKAEVFRMYGSARQSFFSHTFRHQLKSSLTEIRYSTYCPADPSRQMSAKWLSRKHVKVVERTVPSIPSTPK